MNPLTAIEVLHLLECIKRTHGITIGYADDAQVARLQGKLSIMLEVKLNLGDPSAPAIPLPKQP